MYDEFRSFLETTPSHKSGRRISKSAKKYADAIVALDEKFIEKGLIDKSIYFQDINEFDSVVHELLNDNDFIELNTRGHQMYSNALEHYQHYLHNR